MEDITNEILDGVHKPSFLPNGKRWKLIFHDEFDGDRLDTSKWEYRAYMLQHRRECFAQEGARLDGNGNLLLTLMRNGDHFCSPQLQTGSNFMDEPPTDSYGKYTWPIAAFRKPKFTHTYGYYEIRCKLQTQEGWWSAFWLQSPSIGASPNAELSGVEIDIMEAFSPDGTVSHHNHWGGYGRNHVYMSSGSRTLAPTPDGFHRFGLDWSRDGYVYYIDGEESWRCAGPVSQVPQFIMLTTECMGYRNSDSPSPKLFEAALPDYFTIDYVRVFDEINDENDEDDKNR